MPFKHFLRLLTLLALLLAPAGMMGGHAAMAAGPNQGAASTAGHCPDMDGARHEAPDEQAPVRNIDCMMACSCMPPLGAELGAPPMRSAAPEPAATPFRMTGLTPQAEPPPPRLS